MFGTDEFGNSRLFPFAFVLVLAVLGAGVIATSDTMWGPSQPKLVISES